MTCIILLENPCINDLIKELTALAELHNDVYIPVVLKRFEHLADIGVVQVLQYLNFQQEPLFIPDLILGDNFNRPLMV